MGFCFIFDDFRCHIRFEWAFEREKYYVTNLFNI